MKYHGRWGNGTNLRHCHLRTPSEERLRVRKQRLDLLPQRSNNILPLLFLDLFIFSLHHAHHQRLHFREVCLDKEADLGALEGRLRGFMTGGEEVRGEAVGEELRYDAGFYEGLVDDVIAVLD